MKTVKKYWWVGLILALVVGYFLKKKYGWFSTVKG
jgi:hypothetical protein